MKLFRELIMSLEEKLAVVPKLPNVRLTLVSAAQTTREKLEAEDRRHAEARAGIDEQFELEVWRHVEKQWTKKEILSVL